MKPVYLVSVCCVSCWMNQKLKNKGYLSITRRTTIQHPVWLETPLWHHPTGLLTVFMEIKNKEKPFSVFSWCWEICQVMHSKSSLKRFIYLHSVHAKIYSAIIPNIHTKNHNLKKCIPHLLKNHTQLQKCWYESSVNGGTAGRAAHQKSSSSSLFEYAATLGKQNQVNEWGPEGNEKNQNQK